MIKNVSYRCGTNNCEHSCPMKVRDSKCLIYDDRRECQKSLQKRSQSAKHSRRINKQYSQIKYGW